MLSLQPLNAFLRLTNFARAGEDWRHESYLEQDEFAEYIYIYVLLRSCCGKNCMSFYGIARKRLTSYNDGRLLILSSRPIRWSLAVTNAGALCSRIKMSSFQPYLGSLVCLARAYTVCTRVCAWSLYFSNCCIAGQRMVEGSTVEPLFNIEQMAKTNKW